MRDQVMANSHGAVPNLIENYMHCRKCLQEKPQGQSAKEWARLEVGLTKSGDIQVRCTRHDLNVYFTGVIGES